MIQFPTVATDFPFLQAFRPVLRPT